MSTSNGSTERPPHGFADDERGRFLRARPTPAAIAWVERALHVRVLRHRALKGGSSSSIHRLRVMRASGDIESIILRRYVLPELNEEEPDIAAREARALRLLTNSHCSVPTPDVLAVDGTGAQAGTPALVMSSLPGRLDWFPADMSTWQRKLAETLPEVHGLSLPPDHGIPDFFPYEGESWDPPPWMKDPSLWHRAVEYFHGPTLDPERAFIHRDYHPGNVLWRRGRITGVVDWQAASIGPPSVDVYCCAGNIHDRFGLEAADQFVHVWEDVSGGTYNPWVTVVMAVDACAYTGNDRQTQEDIELTLARALAQLHG